MGQFGSNTITYTLTLGDLYQFQLHFYAVRQRAAYLTFRWVAPAVPIVSGVLLFGARSDFQGRAMLILFCAAGLALAILAPFVWRAGLRRQVRRTAKAIPGFGRPMQLTLSSEGVALSAASQETRMDWSAIHEITETDAYLFLWLSRLYAVVVPRRSMAEPEAFAAEVRSWFTNSEAPSADRAPGTEERPLRP